MRSWPANLADRMDWISDGPIIRGWQLLKGARPRHHETARDRFLQAVERGLPVYAEGLRLLVDGLKVIARKANWKDRDVQGALEQIGRFAASADWSRPFVTFTGNAPDRPDATALIGFPESRDGLIFLYSMTVGDLIDHGLVRPGTSWELNAQLIRQPRAERVTATVTPTGMLGTHGEYPTPEAALLPEFLSTTDAWGIWRRADGLTFADLREQAHRWPRVDSSATSVAEAIRSAAGPGQLTRREQEVAALAVRGLSNSQIAARLVISARTVETHLANIFNKLGVSARARIAASSAAKSRPADPSASRRAVAADEVPTAAAQVSASKAADRNRDLAGILDRASDLVGILDRARYEAHRLADTLAARDLALYTNVHARALDLVNVLNLARDLRLAVRDLDLAVRDLDLAVRDLGLVVGDLGLAVGDLDSALNLDSALIEALDLAQHDLTRAPALARDLARVLDLAAGNLAKALMHAQERAGDDGPLGPGPRA